MHRWHKVSLVLNRRSHRPCPRRAGGARAFVARPRHGPKQRREQRLPPPQMLTYRGRRSLNWPLESSRRAATATVTVPLPLRIPCAAIRRIPASSAPSRAWAHATTHSHQAPLAPSVCQARLPPLVECYRLAPADDGRLLQGTRGTPSPHRGPGVSFSPELLRICVANLLELLCQGCEEDPRRSGSPSAHQSESVEVVVLTGKPNGRQTHGAHINRRLQEVRPVPQIAA